MRVLPWLKEHWAGAGVVCLAGLLYLFTIQTDINGAESPYTPDVGEIVNALNLWGTLHQAGYPAYSILGSAFVTVVKLFGPSPALAAGLWSWLWCLVAVGLTYAIAMRLTGRWWAAAPAALALAATRAVWVNGSIAELQSFSLSMAALSLWLALSAAEQGQAQPRWFGWLAVVFGLAVSHGRALVLLTPALAMLLWRPYFELVRRQPHVLGLHALLACLPWLSYIYLPLRAAMGAVWTFGKPTTWETLRPFLTADETRTNVTWPASPGDWLARTQLHLEVLNTDLLPGVLVVGLVLALLVPLLERRYGRAVFLTLAWLPFFGAAYLAYVGYIWDAYLAVLMPVSLVGALGLAAGLGWLAHWRLRWAQAAAAGLAVLGALAAWLNAGYVSQLKQADQGRKTIETFKQAAALEGPGVTVLSAPWGLDYFALAYGALVTREIPNVVIYEQNGPFAELLANGHRLYVQPRYFYVFNLDFWDAKLGRTFLTSAAPGLVQVSNRPALTPTDVSPVEAAPIGDSIVLLGHQSSYDAQANALHVVLYWQAQAIPNRDYSVFVHLSDQPAVITGEDILAQWDSAVPVYGFYPTTRWSPGEIVREDYVISLPDARRPTLLRVGLYTRTAEGGFDNLGEASFPLAIP